jgi:UDP-N-acetylmuramyl tripeptide synthase
VRVDRRPAASGLTKPRSPATFPRGEPPRAIADANRAGAPTPRAEWTDELDRRAAIDRAIAEAATSDDVVIAGKGDEDTQEIGTEKLPFSDAEVAAAAMAQSSSRKRSGSSP